MEKITRQEAIARFKCQGVESHRDYATVCVICGTVQSMTSLVRAGAEKDKVGCFFGFSCEGRFTKAGPWPSPTDKSAKAKKRRTVRGCDWTLGGLFTLHKLEVIQDDGGERPCFEIATPEQAQQLAREMQPEAVA